MVADYGFQAVEIPAYRRSTQFVAKEALINKDRVREIKQTLKETGLVASALTCHEDSMLLMGPYGPDTDHIIQGTPEEKLKYGMDSLIETAQAANVMEIPVVVGFTGVGNWGRYYPFPNRQGWAIEEELFAERLTPVMDKFKEYGVKYAVEPNPINFVYDIHTAQRALELLDNHPNFGFNLDPANMMYLGLRIENFINRFGDRIFNVHAKDGEVVAHNIEMGGILMTGSWRRLDRAYRFRVPGWGDVPWRKIITELKMVDYDNVMSYEHEDITMSREDGLEQVIHFLKPLIIKNPYVGPWRAE